MTFYSLRLGWLGVAAATALLTMACDDGGGGAGGEGGSGGDTDSGGAGGGNEGGSGGGDSAAGRLMGFGWDSGAMTMNLVELDRESGSVSAIGALPPQPGDTFELGTRVFDPASGHVFVVVDQDLPDPVLVLEMAPDTGAVVATTPLVLGEYATVELMAMGATGDLVGVAFTGGPDPDYTPDVVKVNPASGAITAIGTLPPAPGGDLPDLGDSAHDAASNHLYLLVDTDAADPIRLLTINTATGELVSETEVQQGIFSTFGDLHVNNAGELVGIASEAWDTTPPAPSLIRLDPLTGTVSPFGAPLPPPDDMSPEHASAFDPAQNHLVLLSGLSVLTIDASTGDVASTMPITLNGLDGISKAFVTH